MAFTIFETPFESLTANIRFTPSFNRVLIRALSDDVLNYGFKYRVTISEYYFQAMTQGQTIAILKYDPLPDINEAIEFDISRIVNTEFIYNEILKEQNVVGFTNEITRGIIVNVAETWIDENTGAIIEGDDTEGIFKIFPGAFSMYQLPFFDPAQYTNPVTLRPLTFQKVTRISVSDRTNFCFFNPLNQIVGFKIFVEYVDGTTTLTTLNPSFVTNNKDVTILTILPFDYQINPANMKQLSVSVLTTGGGELLAGVVVPIYCKKDNSFPLYWLNEFGTFDTMLFEGYSRQMFETRRESYQKQYFGDGYSPAFSTSEGKFDVTRPTYFSQGNERVKLVSNWLTDAELYNLKNLFASSLIYLKRPSDPDFVTTPGSNDLIPVKAIPTSYEIKQTRSDKTTQITFDVELSEPFNRQSI